MNCPACSEALSEAQDRCPACGASLAAPVIGALAPDLSRLTPPAREKSERVVEVPAFRKKEPSWKDEVRERVRHRKQKRSDSLDLPFLDEGPVEDHESEPSSSEPAHTQPLGRDMILDEPIQPAVTAREVSEPEVIDLPLRPAELAQLAPAESDPEREPRLSLGRFEEEEAVTARAERSWSEPQGQAPEAEAEPPLLLDERPVERPAYLAERVQAAGVDALLLGSAMVVVVYFASRAARVPLLGLLPAWPWIAGFLALFGLVYAACFTGVRGQTLGKMLLGLRVVDSAGNPPGEVRATLRAVLGLAGSLLLVGLLPVFLDPARRALHDRLLKTRVIKA